MAFNPTVHQIGFQRIADTSTTKQHALGTIITATDPTLGVGEFIYLLGVTSTEIGSIVNYDAAFQTALDSSSANIARPLAIAMSANVGSAYGWYQISGLAVARKASATTFADDVALGSGSGLAIAAVSGVVLTGAIVRTATTTTGTAANFVAIAINRPSGPNAS